MTRYSDRMRGYKLDNILNRYDLADIKNKKYRYDLEQEGDEILSQQENHYQKLILEQKLLVTV